MANLTILRTYASKSPEKLPMSILFSHSDDTIALYDAYPKSIFHFLVVPRIRSPSPTANQTQATGNSDAPRNASTSHSTSDLSSLRALLNSKGVSKEEAKGIILSLKEAALKVKTEIEQEMEKRYGFVWGVWIGFHRSPSMEHIHLHVLSADLCSEKMKNKKHYNSFHPKLGFFLDVDKVLSWFDAEPSYYQTVAKLLPTKYEPFLKEPLSCFHCNSDQKNMPTLKSHLQEEWERLQTGAENRKKRKIKPENDQEFAPPSSNQASFSGVNSGDVIPVRKKLRGDDNS